MNNQSAQLNNSPTLANDKELQKWTALRWPFKYIGKALKEKPLYVLAFAAILAIYCVVFGEGEDFYPNQLAMWLASIPILALTVTATKCAFADLSGTEQTNQKGST